MAGVTERCKGYEYFPLFSTTDKFDDACTYNRSHSAEKGKQYAAQFVFLRHYPPCLKAGGDVGYFISTAQIIDKAVLKAELPPPCLAGIEGILVDEKYLGPSFSFITLVINARIGAPLHIARGKVGVAPESFFKLLSDNK